MAGYKTLIYEEKERLFFHVIELVGADSLCSHLAGNPDDPSTPHTRRAGACDAELDADGVPETSIVTTIFFTIAVLLLGVITVGILYLSAREALDRKEERDAREEEERQARVIEANKNNKNFAPKAKKQKVTPSMQASGLNRRERRKKEREAEDA